MDGQNVKKSLMDKLNQLKRDKGYQQLVNCPPSCLIHVCHNSFHQGIQQYGLNAEDLCQNLYYFFKKSSCRREDLLEIKESLSLDELVLLCHI